MDQSLTTWPFEWVCKPPFLRQQVPLLVLSTAREKTLKNFSIQKKIDNSQEARCWKRRKK
jgi:hypothetical protein